MGIAIQKLFAQLLFWLYEFLDTIFEMFQVLCGIERVSVDGMDGEESILNIFLESSSVTKAFLLIFLVAVLVAALSTIIAVVKNIINMKGGERKPHSRTIGQGFGAIITSLVMAVVMLTGITMSNYVLQKVNDATAPDSNLTLASQLFDMSVGKSYAYEDKPIYEPVYILDEFGDKIQETDENGLPLFDEEGNEVWKVERDEQGNIKYEEKLQIKRDEDGNPITESGWRNNHTAADIDFSIMTPDDVFGVHKKDFVGLFEDPNKSYEQQPMVEMKSFNFWTAYLVVIVILVALIFSMLGLVKRIFDIVMLFIVLPLISATIPLDDGARFKQWRDTVVSKIMLAYGALLSVNVFLLIVPTINSIDFTDLGWSALMENLFKAFLLMGGALAINGGQLLVARLMGTSADESREMAHSARALLGGVVAAGGLARGAKNVVMGGYNKYGRYRTGILPFGARAANTAGNFFGGEKYQNSKAGGLFRFLGRYGHGGNKDFGLRHGKTGGASNSPSAANSGASNSANLSSALSGNPAGEGANTYTAQDRAPATAPPTSAPNNAAPADKAPAEKHKDLINNVLPKEGDGGYKGANY